MKGAKMTNEITLSQGLTWMKTLRERHKELIELRNDNSKTKRRLWGETKEDVVETPTYDVKSLDKIANRAALEIRRLDNAIKATNAKVVVEGYELDESVLGELE